MKSYDSDEKFSASNCTFFPDSGVESESDFSFASRLVERLSETRFCASEER